MRQELWLYPAVEILHIVGFVILVGSIAMLDLRLLGLSRELPVRRLAGHLLPWTLGALLVIVPTGLLMFMAHASDLIDNRAFVVKISLIGVAGIECRGVSSRPLSRRRAVGQRRPLRRRRRRSMRRHRSHLGRASSHAAGCWPIYDAAAGLRRRVPGVRGAGFLRALPAALPGTGPVPAVHRPARRLYRARGGFPGRRGAWARAHGRGSLWRHCFSS